MVQQSVFLFDPDNLRSLADDYRSRFAQASPFPHVVIDNFMPAWAAERVLEAFPGVDDPCWLDWTKRDIEHQPKKQGIGNAGRLRGVDPFIQSVLAAFNGHEFIRFLESLTGLKGLVPDPHFYGGGLHQILPGGHLDIHADFNLLAETKLYRRTNVILYLNENWRDDYRGSLELWRQGGERAEVEIAPVFNRLVAFQTDLKSLHGHPTPLACPEGMTRRSIAIYHYSVDPWPGQEQGEKVNWQTHGGRRDPA